MKNNISSNINMVLDNPFSREVTKGVKITPSLAKKQANNRLNKSFWSSSLFLRSVSVGLTTVGIGFFFEDSFGTPLYLGYTAGFISALVLEVNTKFINLTATHYTDESKLSNKDKITKDKIRWGGVAVITTNLLTNILGGYYIMDHSTKAYLEHKNHDNIILTQKTVTKRQINLDKLLDDKIQNQLNSGEKVLNSSLLAQKRTLEIDKVISKFDKERLALTLEKEKIINEIKAQYTDRFKTKRFNLIQEQREIFEDKKLRIDTKQAKRIREIKLSNYDVSTIVNSKYDTKISKFDTAIVDAKKSLKEAKAELTIYQGSTGFNWNYLISSIFSSGILFLLLAMVDRSESHSRIVGQGGDMEDLKKAQDEKDERKKQKINNPQPNILDNITNDLEQKTPSFLETRSEEKKPFSHNDFEGKNEPIKVVGFNVSSEKPTEIITDSKSQYAYLNSANEGEFMIEEPQQKRESHVLSEFEMIKKTLSNNASFIFDFHVKSYKTIGKIATQRELLDGVAIGTKAIGNSNNELEEKGLLSRGERNSFVLSELAKRYI